MFEIIKNSIPGLINFAQKQGASFLLMVSFVLFMYSLFMDTQLENALLNADLRNRLTITEANYTELNKKFNEVLLTQIIKSNSVIEDNSKTLEEFNMYQRYRSLPAK